MNAMNKFFVVGYSHLSYLFRFVALLTIALLISNWLTIQTKMSLKKFL